MIETVNLDWNADWVAVLGFFFFIYEQATYKKGIPSGSVVKNLPTMQETSIPGLGNGNPFQYSCLGNSMDREACTPRKSGLHANGEGERVIALKS